MWKPTPELRLVKKTIKEQVDHTFMNERTIQVLEQLWTREGFQDGEKYVIESQWRPIPEVA